MPNGSNATKMRLLDAACDEFAAHGIAGARTGRIAKAAGANEALLFRYFGNKQLLFDQVYESLVVKTVDDVPIDPSNLAAYAGALFDYYQEHQQVLRLAVWMALERPAAPTTDAVLKATATKVAAIARAQELGIVSTNLRAEELLTIVIQLSLTGADVSPSLGPYVQHEVRRASVVAAVDVLARVWPQPDQPDAA